MPAAPSSPIPAVLAKLGPLETDAIADLRPYLDSVPDPGSRRGRWHSLTAILLVGACASLSGARSIDELVEWGARAGQSLMEAIGIRRHLLRRRTAPSRATIGRVLERLDGDALDAAVGALEILVAINIAKTTRASREEPARALPILGITYRPNPSGT